VVNTGHHHARQREWVTIGLALVYGENGYHPPSLSWLGLALKTTWQSKIKVTKKIGPFNYIIKISIVKLPRSSFSL
jgi:hypothetical protein